MSEIASPVIVLAAGGTGGHMYPAQALALELGRRGFRIVLFTDKRGDAFFGLPDDVETYSIKVGSIAGKNLMGKVKSLFAVLIGTWQAGLILKRLNPQTVIGFGGYASVPTMLAASFGKYKTIIHEQNAVFGRANSLLAARVDHIATSFQFTDAGAINLYQSVICTGMPVREPIKGIENLDYPAFGIEAPLNILVLGGSQGARVLSKVVPEALGQLHSNLRARIRITQQCRSEDLEQAKRAYVDIGVKAELKSFFNNIGRRLKNCHLFIGRSGASTVAELQVIGRPSILIPYPYAADDHQTKNACAIYKVGAGWVMPEIYFTSENLANRLEFFFNHPATLLKAADCAKAVGKPGATEALADVICGIWDINSVENKQEKKVL